MPKVSIILPVYNAERHITGAIESILSQSFVDFELIIVANGSNEATLDQIKAFDDTRIKLLHLDEPDVVAAMNHGIKHAAGKYIARTDADDTALKYRLEIQTQFLDNHPEYDVVTGDVKYEGDKDKNTGYYLHVKWLNSLNDHNDIFLNRFVDSPVANPSLMIRRELFNQYGLYIKGPFPEDYEMVLRWLYNGVKVGKVKETVLTWMDHPERLTRNHSHYSQKAFYRIKTEYFAKWFCENNTFGDEVLVWGTGKSVREKSKLLNDYGIQIVGYIEVKENFHSSSPEGKPIYHFSNFPENKFILSYVSDRKGRLAILDYLLKKGYKAGKHFYLMS